MPGASYFLLTAYFFPVLAYSPAREFEDHFFWSTWVIIGRRKHFHGNKSCGLGCNFLTAALFAPFDGWRLRSLNDFGHHPISALGDLFPRIVLIHYWNLNRHGRFRLSNRRNNLRNPRLLDFPFHIGRHLPNDDIDAKASPQLLLRIQLLLARSLLFRR